MITADTIDRIAGFSGGELPVVSMYWEVDVDPGNRDVHGHVEALLRRLRAMADDQSLGHEARTSMKQDIERIEEAAAEPWRPGAGAIFACSGAGFFEEVALPRAVQDRLVVDATPWVRPMLAVLDEYHRACVAVVDRQEARLWELYQDEIRSIAHAVKDPVLRDPNHAGFGGVGEHNVHRRAEELAKRHFRRAAEQVRAAWEAGDYELLIVGGHLHDAPAFVEQLPALLRDRVAGTFSIDPSTATTETIRREADAIVERYEREQERQLVASVLERAAAGGRAVVGLDDCLWAGSVAAIEQLLVQDGATEPGVVCDRDHWMARAGDTCPICGNPTRHTPDVIDELAEAVIAAGGAVEDVIADTELREHEVAAALRFVPAPRSER